ncbi:hypothetical protein [Micromonospora sp. WP24]|uniref:hypothetical protein n=1 Tax=Micromonospora sp. WP24 TaxID=2604469 RepID=UPI001651DCB4|nr:hypothetical protein [Micromonospora sp. WP24]
MRRLHTDREIDAAFDTGYQAGRADEAERHRERDEQITRLARAADAAENGDYSLLDEFAREHGVTPPGDGFLEVADAAGVTPLPDVDGGQLVDELEAWLRGGAA